MNKENEFWHESIVPIIKKMSKKEFIDTFDSFLDKSKEILVSYFERTKIPNTEDLLKMGVILKIDGAVEIDKHPNKKTKVKFKKQEVPAQAWPLVGRRHWSSMP